MRRFSVNARKVVLVSVSLALFLALICFYRVSVMSPRTIRVPADFATIQAAINNASDGDTIWVYNGTYPEHLEVNKSVTLLAVDGPDKTIIEGDGNGTVVDITAPGPVHLEGGFTIQNGTIGLLIESPSNGDYIESNNIIDSMWGIYINFSTGNTLRNNNMTANGTNFMINGDVLQDFVQDIDASNRVNGNPMTTDDGALYTGPPSGGEIVPRSWLPGG